MIGYALLRLAKRVGGVASHDLTWYHWVALGLITALLVYGKSYRAFYLGLAPRIAARAADVRRRPSTVRVVLAPMYCMGYFGGERSTQVKMISITLAMVILVVSVRCLPEPWRAILAAAVAAALSAGFGFILARILKHRPSD